MSTHARSFISGLLILLFSFSVSSANKILVMDDGQTVIYATPNNLLQRWNKGESRPAWSTSIGGQKRDLRSHIALLHQFGKGRFIVVERFGDVNLVNTDDPNKAVSKFPVFSRIKLKGSPGKVNLAEWSKHVRALDRLGAAAIGPDGALYLSSSLEVGITKLDLEKFFKQEGKSVRTSDDLRFSFDDDNFIMSMRVGELDYATELSLPADDPGQQTALAACGSTMISGTSGGVVYFISTNPDRRDDGRIRELSDQNSRTGMIIDAGCLANGLSYTATFQTGNGQVQLWDVGERAMLDSVDTGGTTNLITFQATRSSEGKRLLAVGDTRLRVWSTESRKLQLTGQIRIENLDNRYAAAPTPDGRFVVTNGESFWTLSSDGSRMDWFAGKKP